MFITAIILALLAAFVLVKSGIQSSNLVENTVLRRMVVAGAIVAAGLGGALIFEILWPAEPSFEGDFAKVGDELPLGDVQDGVLNLECEMVEGQKKTGYAVNIRMALESADQNQKFKAGFQVGDSAEDMDHPVVERMAVNIPVKSIGKDVRIRLTQHSGEGNVTIRAAYRPGRIPFYMTFFVFLGLAVLAVAYEGAAPLRSQRTFLSVTFLSVATFIWFCEGGLTVDDGIGTIWLRFSYSVALGAVLGSFLPAIAGWILPGLEAPAPEIPQPDVENEEDEGGEEDTSV